MRGDVSSQFLTALLMALPLLDREVTVDVVGELISKPYIEITLAMMARFGVKVQRDGWRSFTVAAGSRYRSPGVIYVEGDASSASYFLAAGAIGGGPLRIEGVGSGSIQGDVRFADALALMGAQIEMGANWMEARAPKSGRLKAIELDCNHIPDAAMTLAVVALFAEGTTTLRNIASWRVKETDRIAAMATELRKVGATVEEGADYIRITPPGMHPPCRHRHLRRSPHGDVFFAGRVWRGRHAHQRSALCRQDFPELFHAVARCGAGRAGDRDRRAVGIRQGHGGAAGRGTGSVIIIWTAARCIVCWRWRRSATSVLLTDEAGSGGIGRTHGDSFRGQADICLDGVLVGDELRGEQCAAAASKVAALPGVRAALLNKQHAFRRAPGLVADGRDMGSVVFPDAALKIFLTASAEARADRRYKQLKEKGIDANIAALLLDIRVRDERDTQRSASPLQQAPGASLLDTTALSIDEAVQDIEQAVQESAGRATRRKAPNNRPRKTLRLTGTLTNPLCRFVFRADNIFRCIR